MTDRQKAFLIKEKQLFRVYKKKINNFVISLKKKIAETYELMKKVYGDDSMKRT